MTTRRAFLKGALTGTTLAGVACATRGVFKTYRNIPTVGVCIHPDFRKQCPPIGDILRVMQSYVAILRPIWGVDARIVAIDRPKPDAGIWNFIFAQDSEAFNGALAYHDFDPGESKYPYALVEVPEAIQHDGNVTVAATHELVEMLCDPGTSYWADPVTLSAEDEDDPKTMLDAKLLAFETADPVQGSTFKLDGEPVSDFVFPAYFEPFRDGQLDYLEVLSKPFQVAYGGYQIVRSSTGVGDVFGPGAPSLRCHRYRRILRKWQANQSNSGAAPTT